MNLKSILNEQTRQLVLDNKTMSYLKQETENIVEKLKEEIKNEKIDAEVFVGGSYAKRTLVKKNKYDIDIFVRFNWKLDNISDILENIVKNAGRRLNLNFLKIHGSRDYFRLETKNNLYFEIVPVYRIKTPKEARNVTDLSYFHVNYVRKKLRGNNIASEILLAKQFCEAQGVYGAETYILGFSGYGLECLTIYYKTFVNMLKKLISAKDRIVIDIEGHYKNKSDVLFSLNENKLQSPIILVDPTWKERNVLSALNKESFNKFQDRARKFLKRPSADFFKPDELDIDKLRGFAKDENAEFLDITITTERQAGDIAGAKMRKFSRFLESEIARYFDILKKEFLYSEGKDSNFYIVAKSKKEVIKQGPPISMKKQADAFKRYNKNAFEKGGFLHAREIVNFSLKEFLERFKEKQRDKIRDMGISGIDLV